MHPTFLISTQLFTQPSSLTNSEIIHDRVDHNPTLIPSPGIIQLPNFSGNVLAGIYSPNEYIPPLCVSHFVSIPFSHFQHPGPSWCQAALHALVGERAGDLTLLPISCSRLWDRVQQPWSPHRSQGPYHPSTISLPSVFQCPLQLFASKLHMSWDSVSCSHCS